MKTLLTSLVVFLSIALMSCSSVNSVERQQKKQIEASIDSINAVYSHNALKNRKFVMSIGQIVFKHGGTTQVIGTTNFLSLDSLKAVIQISFPQVAPGLNGIGGVTVEGTARNIRYSVDKKGTATLMYVVSGKGVVADVTVRLPKGQTSATATVDAGYSTAGMTVFGNIVPLSNERVVKGTAL